MKSPSSFIAITSEGGLLPADFLHELPDPKTTIEGVTPVAYHLAEGERLNEQINRSWNRLKGCWENFKKAIAEKPAGDPTTTDTRERWLFPLFQELGFGRLTASKAIEVDGHSYPVSHGWNQVPIHLIGTHADLDHRTPGAIGASKASPHSLVQSALNASDAHLWGIVSNGLNLRLLRDNVALTRLAYVEFDLQAMFDGDLYSEFFVLWLVCHQSRFEGEKPTQYWLERWKKSAEDKTLRALDDLYPGVKKAIVALGSGLVSHPGNTALREKLRTGKLTTQEFYRQVLRVIYRMLFLLVAEDRDLLHPPLPLAAGHSPLAHDLARQRYRDFYSIARLRSLTLYRSGTPHPDLWHVFQFVTTKLGSDTGCPELALPPLGSFLWSAAQSTPDLLDSLISNRHFLEAVHAIAFVQDGNVRRAVDYKNLGSEELGSVYQGLLEMHPRINADAGSFELDTAAGNERKTSGSYYTPDSLVQCLLDSALEPVIAERLAEARRMASGEWRVVDGVWRSAFANYANQRLSRSGGLAARTTADQETISTHPQIPGRGEVRADLATAPGGGVHPLEHSGGLGTPLHGGVHSVPPQSQRQPDRSGDPAYPERGLGVRDAAGSGQPAQANRLAGQKAAESGTELGATPEAVAQLWRSTPLAIRHSLFAEQALLALKVCDMAAGSGHFIIRAGHRIARHLARVRSGEEEPSPRVYQTALRDVIGHCLYGVDINPMAVELCKVTLWLEALEPGKPLSFLDHHIRCGNSLLGATPELIAAGLPDDAFEAIEGDDKAACASLKKLNRAQREGLRHMFIAEDTAIRERLHQAAAAIDEISDSRPEDIHRKEAAFRSAQTNYDFGKAWDLANLWCAAFVIKKQFAGEAIASGAATIPASAESATLNDQPLVTQGGLFGGTEELPKTKGKKAKASSHASSEIPIGITTQNLRDFVEGGVLPDGLISESKRLADNFQFFHFHLAFPEVFAQGGFDCSLGNPPWERVNLEARQFFAASRPDIAEAMTSKRRDLLKELESTHPELMREFQEAQRRAASEIAFFQSSGVYPHLNQARLNTYVLFTELNAKFCNASGRCGIIVPSGVATDDISKHLFSFLIEEGRLVSLFDFENRDALFPGVHRSYKFCLLTLRGKSQPAPARLSFFLNQPGQLREADRIFSLTAEELQLLSPLTGLCPTFRCKGDREIVLALYRRVKPLVKQQEEKLEWSQSDFLIMFRSDDSTHLYKSPAELGVAEPNANSLPRLMADQTAYVPVWESKFLHQFDHRFATFAGVNESERKKGNCHELDSNEKETAWIALPRYWAPLSAVSEILASRAWRRSWTLGYRDITNATNERTAIASCLPEGGAAQPLNLFLPETGLHGIFWLASMNSMVLDYVARQRIGGVHLNITTCRQLPVLGPANLSSDITQFIRDHVLELVFTSPALESFAQDCGWSGPPFRWDEDRRFLLRCELDAAFFHLYLGPETEWRQQPAALTQAFPTPRAALAYILDTFPIVKRKDEAKFNGDYRTKRVILEIYDALAVAMQTGKAYQTRLNPAPASLAVAHPWDWQTKPLELPAVLRVPLPESWQYVVNVMVELLWQAGGSLPWRGLRTATDLLSDRQRFARLGELHVGQIALDWLALNGDSFDATHRWDQLSGFCHQGTMRVVRRNDELIVELMSADGHVLFPHVRFDARLAITVVRLQPVAAPTPAEAKEELRVAELIPA